MLFDNAKNGPSTWICVACAFIASSFASACSVPSTSQAIASSGTMNRGGLSRSNPSNGFSIPRSAIASALLRP